MKKLVVQGLAVALICTAAACGSGSSDAPISHQDAVDSASNANKKAMPVAKDASDFAVAAANGGMMEVELGKVAESNAMNPRVKAFGEMMVKDHSDAGATLKTIAGRLNITLPDSVSDDARKEIEMLKTKKGKAFDKAYVDMMVDDHKTDIAEFRKCADNCSDSAIKNFANTTLPTLEKHLDSIQAIAGVKK